MTTTPPRWYQNPRLRRYLAHSEYITSFTNWFMGLIGRATEIVLYATVLYSSAQLYPGVKLPARLSLAVFLIQMGALDVGGLALSKLAKQARKDNNTEGAEAAMRLSHWLIGIMLAGVVTIGLEHALPFPLPSFVTIPIDVALVVARSICAVLYGRVVHELKTDAAEHETNEGSQQVDALATAVTEQVQHLASELALVQENLHRRLSSELANVREGMQMQLATELAATRESLQHYQELLSSLPALQARVHQLESTPRGEICQPGERRPVLRALPAVQHKNQTALQAKAADKFDARAFVFACLSENPALKLSEIERRARAVGQELSQSSNSRYRKELFTRSANRHESSSMQGVSYTASSLLQVQGHDASVASSERKVAGE